MMLRTKWFKFGVSLQYMVKHSSSSSSSPSNMLRFNYEPKFSSIEQEKILSIINQSNKDQLLRFNIAQNKIKNLESYKRRNGPFKSLDELLEIDGLSIRMLEKLCKQIISESTNANPVNNESKKIKQLLVPPLGADAVVSTSVGIHLAPMGVSWAKICSTGNQLECWGFQDFGNLPKKMCPVDTFKQAVHIINQLPSGDVYIFEGAANMGLQGQKQCSTVTSHTQQLELNSMLLALINTSTRHNVLCEENESVDCDKMANCVYFLKSKVAARLFKTLVGNECVSCTTRVMHLLGDLQMENFALPCTPITVSRPLKNDYLAQSSAHKELLGQALMLTVAFLDLFVRKNPLSIQAVSSSRK